jgi:hypothetical protein
MSVEVRWYDESQTFLVIGLIYPWNWSELETGFKRSVEILDTVDHVVHFLVEFPIARGKPEGNGLAYLKRILQNNNAHPRAGVVYLVNPNPIARSMVQVIQRLYRGETHGLRIVANREEALRLGQAAN